MKLKDAVSRILEQDKIGNYVFHTQDLRAIFHEDSDRSFVSTVARLTAAGFLKRATKGVFFNPDTRNLNGTILERLAGTMRRGELCYLSLESVLSGHSIISQQLMGTITVMTTGKSGRYVVDGLGAIEFTHTKKKVQDIMDNLLFDTGFLPHATAEFAYTELKRVGRNIHLVDEDILEEVIHEQRAARLPIPG